VVERVIGTVIVKTQEDCDKVYTAFLSFLRLLQGLMKDKIGFTVDVNSEE